MPVLCSCPSNACLYPLRIGLPLNGKCNVKELLHYIYFKHGKGIHIYVCYVFNKIRSRKKW